MNEGTCLNNTKIIGINLFHSLINTKNLLQNTILMWRNENGRLLHHLTIENVPPLKNQIICRLISKLS
jgi:hypothetical protein